MRICQGDCGFSSLPDEGGVMDQSCIMTDAIILMMGFESMISDEKSPPYNSDGEIDYAKRETEALKSWGIPV